MTTECLAVFEAESAYDPVVLLVVVEAGQLAQDRWEVPWVVVCVWAQLQAVQQRC